MKKEEYLERLKQLTERFEYDKKALSKECALSNSDIKEGDIFTDHIGSIKVEKIKFTYSSYREDIPTCVYYGLELKKDGTPTKKLTKRDAYQSNKI